MLALATKLLNFFHILILIAPIAIFFIPIPIIKPYAKFILLISCLIPLHWVFVDNHCIFTKLSKNMGDYEETKTNSGFSEANLKWLYEPIMRLFDWNWNSRGLAKMVTLHWIFNIVIVWYYCFYLI
jgi:hypothetical protein